MPLAREIARVSPAAIAAASARLAPLGDRAVVVKSNYSEVASVVKSLGYEKIDGLLLDLGVSSYQLDTAERGFSYNADAPLDMRMNVNDPVSAYDIVNTYGQQELEHPRDNILLSQNLLQNLQYHYKDHNRKDYHNRL